MDKDMWNDMLFAVVGASLFAAFVFVVVSFLESGRVEWKSKCDNAVPVWEVIQYNKLGLKDSSWLIRMTPEEIEVECGE